MKSGLLRAKLVAQGGRAASEGKPEVHEEVGRAVVRQRGQAMRVALMARILGGSVEMDYRGGDPQWQSSPSMPTCGHEWCARTPAKAVRVSGALRA
jgi:hypothetical protein